MTGGPERYLERHWRPAIIAALVVIALACGYVAGTATNLARDALRTARANKARVTHLKFALDLRSEQVCSRTNRGEPCRQLFARLAQDISPAQEHELACTVARRLAIPADHCPHGR